MFGTEDGSLFVFTAASQMIQNEKRHVHLRVSARSMTHLCIEPA